MTHVLYVRNNYMISSNFERVYISQDKRDGGRPAAESATAVRWEDEKFR